MPAEDLYELSAARSDEQRRRMQQLVDAGVCLFCEDDGAVLLEGEHWYVRENDFPYEGTTGHYLIVARRHVTSFDELPDAAGAELWSIKRRLKERLDPPAVATVERSGDTRYNGGSMAHLHVHLVTLDAEPATTVRFRVSAKVD